MSLREQLQTMKAGFHRTFWVANGMELFERLAYYGQATVFSIYLRDHLHFTEIDAGAISSVFGGLIYFLPIFAGTIADKIGFRKSFTFAFSVLMLGYFLIGSTGMAVFGAIYDGSNLFWVLIPMVTLTAMGGSFIKPSVLGTVAVTSKPETKSLGYAVYYSLVNIGALLGPLIANVVRKHVGIEFVYLVSAVSCGLMLVVNLAFYREVYDPTGTVVESMGKKMENLLLVLRNFRFMTFLLIFGLYWTMFWSGLYVMMPYYITDFISRDADFEIVLSVGAASIMLLQLVVNRLTRHLPPKKAILLGFAISSLCWLIVLSHPSLPVIALGIVVWSIGEMTQAPRYYEYISTLAPKGQQALFQGYAFLPIAIAWGLGGTFGGWLYTAYAKGRPSGAIIWLVLFGVGVLATLLMWVYNRFAAAQHTETEEQIQ